MHPMGHVFLKPVEPKPQPSPQTAAPATPRMAVFRLGEKSRTKPGHDILPTSQNRFASAPLQMDAKTHGKMTRGKLRPRPASTCTG